VSTMTLGWLAVAAYFVVTSTLAARAARQAKSVASYAVGNRDIPAAGRRLVSSSVLVTIAVYLSASLLERTSLHNNPAVLATMGTLSGWAVIGIGVVWQRTTATRQAVG
jgi:Na+/proline symporter